MRVCGIIGGVKKYQTLLWAFAFFAVFADGQPFDRYQTIIDRKPFGPEPANFDPDVAPGTASAEAAGAGELTPEQRTAEEQKLASNVRVSILNVAPDGTVKVTWTPDLSRDAVPRTYTTMGKATLLDEVSVAPSEEPGTVAEDSIV